ncbi:MAG: SagB family peptide dehydrogenase, partial [Tepidisphaeraceae bacterium]
VWEHHRLSKLTSASPVMPADVRLRVDPNRIFDFAPRTALSSKLLDLPTHTLDVLEQGAEALPESLRTPPQDLRTLSTWLYMAAGQRESHRFEWGAAPLRAVPSADATFPTEIYVVAFAIEGLSPGLYHYSPSDFALRKLRDGAETLSLLRRGRPDLNFLSTVPGALLISSVFSRACWRQGRRGYRQALIDAGHVVANCHAVASALGMDVHTRLRMSDAAMRELIGLPEDFDFAVAESVQAMVVWADHANVPMPTGAGAGSSGLAPIPRPGGPERPTYGAVLAVHSEMVARGVATREIRPPLTELTPLPSNVRMSQLLLAREETPNKSLRAVLTEVKQAEEFEKKPLPRDAFFHIARAAFRSGTYFPLRPEGAHVALVRSFWILHEVPGQEPGIWWHDPFTDRWALLNRGFYKFECVDLTRGRELLEHASAVCVVVANLQRLLLEAGPDAYRLALLEAGVVTQRMTLAANSMGFACRVFGDFFDDPWKQFLGLLNTGWEPLAVAAIGMAKPPTPSTLPRGRATYSG